MPFSLHFSSPLLIVTIFWTLNPASAKGLLMLNMILKWTLTTQLSWWSRLWARHSLLWRTFWASSSRSWRRGGRLGRRGHWRRGRGGRSSVRGFARWPPRYFGRGSLVIRPTRPTSSSTTLSTCRTLHKEWRCVSVRTDITDTNTNKNTNTDTNTITISKVRQCENGYNGHNVGQGIGGTEHWCR